MADIELSGLPAHLSQTEAGRTVTSLAGTANGHEADPVVLAWALSSLANTAGVCRDTRTQLAAARSAVEVIRQAASAAPSTPQHRQDLVYLLANLGHALTDAGRFEAAARAFGEAIDVQRLILSSGTAPEHESRSTLDSLLADKAAAKQAQLLERPDRADSRFVSRAPSGSPWTSPSSASASSMQLAPNASPPRSPHATRRTK